MKRGRHLVAAGAVVSTLAVLVLWPGSCGPWKQDAPTVEEAHPMSFPSVPAPKPPGYPPAVAAGLEAARTYLGANDFGRALETLERAAVEAEGHPAARMEVLSWLGLASRRLGDFHQALFDYRRALELAEQLDDDAHRGQILHNMGSCYTSLGELQLARDMLEEALGARTSDWDRAVTLTALATLDDEEGNHELALERLEEALSSRRTAPGISPARRRLGMATTLDRLGTAARNAGLPQKARRSFESARLLLQRVGSPGRLAIVEANLGRLLVASGELDEGTTLLDRALPVLVEAGLRQDHEIALLAKARALARQDRLSDAWALAMEAVERLESVRLDVPGPQLRAAFVANHIDFYQLGIELAMERHWRQPEAGHDSTALELAERAKARSLLDLLREELPSRHLGEPAMRLEELEYRRIRALHRGAPIADIARIEKEQRALILENEGLWGDSPQDSENHSPRTLTVAEIQNLLDPRTVFLVYALGSSESYLWLVAPQQLTTHRLPPGAEIETATTRARRALELSDQPGGFDPATVHELASMLLPPELVLEPDRRLVIVPDGALHALPFGALPGPATGRPLIRDHPILQLPSLSVLRVLGRREAERQPASRTLAVVADPVYGVADPRLRARPGGSPPAYERLGHSAREAKAILGLVPIDQRLGLQGFEARREALLDGRLGDFRVLHFGLHAELIEERPQLTSLLLSRFDEDGQPIQGRIFMHEIGTLSLPADLVVLGACNSALGQQIRGEGLVGLTRAFFLAGASRALVSLWFVDDEATAELMILFHRGLFAEGLAPDEALRRAQIRLPELDERWRAPYFWAGFVLVGDWSWSPGGDSDSHDNKNSLPVFSPIDSASARDSTSRGGG